MKDKKLKVIWICHFSDSKTRAHIKFSPFYYVWVIKKLLGREIGNWEDKAVWISNAINEFEKFDNISLTIIFPHKGIVGTLQEFSINGIKYKCFRSEDDNLFSLIKKRYFDRWNNKYRKNRELIRRIINEESPDIVHLIGAENPYYSMSFLDVPNELPTVVSLQTLMSDPLFSNNYPISKREYEYRTSIEKDIIKKSTYIACPLAPYIYRIKKDIKDNAIFLNMPLAIGENVDDTYSEKIYDFVYFAASIDKAADVAIEAFALVVRKNRNLRLNLSGYCPASYKVLLDKRIEELNIKDSVIFSGPQPTHDAVIKQIKKSRFALIPLKVDLISGTIREAMACGLPVISTITPMTPELNDTRESILLSEKGDIKAMAQNMEKVLCDENLATVLSCNAKKTIKEKYSNMAIVANWRKGYYEIMDNFFRGSSFSSDIFIQ